MTECKNSSLLKKKVLLLNFHKHVKSGLSKVFLGAIGSYTKESSKLSKRVTLIISLRLKQQRFFENCMGHY